MLAIDCAPTADPEVSPLQTPGSVISDAQLGRFRWRMGLVLSLIGILAGAALVLHALRPQPTREAAEPKDLLASLAVAENAEPWQQMVAGNGLVARRRPPVPASEHLTIGQALCTQTAQRRRVMLPDGSILYANQDTSVRLEAGRQLVLVKGEIFVEVAAGDLAGTASFLVKTAQHEISTHKAKLAVRVSDSRTVVLVVQGTVQVKGVNEALIAGQQWEANSGEITTTPRVSHLLAWSRELMAAAEPRLVPENQYAGGTLLVNDSQGRPARLSLRRYHLDVHIEDGFARTTIDQTYFNHEARQLEGTFYFPLPPDASLSRLAMYVVGKLMEGGMAERERARNVFESIVYRKRDPALLEWVDGTTFRMRVFPLEGRQEKRIILSYTQRLPSSYGHFEYHFPAGHSLEQVGQWSFHGRIKGGADFTWKDHGLGLAASKSGPDLLLDAEAQNAALNRDVILEVEDISAAMAQEAARFSYAERDGNRYLMMRYRPQLPPRAGRPRRDWVILFESSADRDPLLARAQIEIVRAVLANAEPEDAFAVLSAGSRAHTFAPELRPITPANIEAAVRFLDRSHLIGALDLGRALDAAKPLLRSGRNPYLVHVGSGSAVLGERKEKALAKRIPGGAHYVGIGVGKRFSREFMKAAADHADGYFTQINPDESITWKVFELMATLATPYLSNARVEDTNGNVEFLTYASTLAQGEELCAVAQLDSADQALPQHVTISGTLDGQPFRRTVPVQKVAKHADYVPPTWAKMEIDRLLADNANDENRDQIVKLSKDMYVMSPYTSLLVLENEEMYQQFQVDRGRKDHWALYPCPEKIPVVAEPLAGKPASAPTRLASQRRAAEEVLETILVRIPPRFFTTGKPRENNAPQNYVTAREVYETAYAVPMWVDNEEDTDPETAFNSAQLRRMGRDEVRVLQRDRLDVEEEGERASMNLQPSGFGLGGGFAGFGGGRRSAAAMSQGLGVGGLGLGGLGVGGLGVGGLGLGGALGGVGIGGFGGGNPPSLGSSGGGLMNLGLYGLSDDRPHMLAWANRTKETTTREAFIRGGASIRPEWFPLARSGQRRHVASIPGTYWGDDDIFSNWTWINGDFTDDVYARPRSSKHGPLSYQALSFHGAFSFFQDLAAQAPGLNTTRADIQAVLDEEALLGEEDTPGAIDPGARALIDRCRLGGWQTLRLPGAAGQPAFQVTFDRRGRYAYKRILPLGLRERVVCDGARLLHLYPELGLGAVRRVSRFHAASFARLLPWTLLCAEDLARGADLRCLDARTIAIVPHETKSFAVVLKFSSDGRLAERRLIARSSGRILQRETYGADGKITRFQAAGEVVTAYQVQLRTTAEPDLKPDTTALIVLPLPLRSLEHWRQSRDWADPTDTPGPTEALSRVATAWATQWKSSLTDLYGRFFAKQGDHRIGWFTLLIGEGENSADWHLGDKFPTEPLAQYLDRMGQVNQPPALEFAGGRLDGYIHSLATFYDLYKRWSQGWANHGDLKTQLADCGRLMGYLEETPSPLFAWALIDVLMRDPSYTDEDTTRRGLTGNEKRERLERFLAFKRQVLNEFERRFTDLLGLIYAARYEYARGLLIAGRWGEAQAAFFDLYSWALKRGMLPPIDASFQKLFEKDDGGTPPWTDLLRQVSSALVARKRRPDVICLAWQWWGIGYPRLADELLAKALAGPLSGQERVETVAAGVEYLWQTGRDAQADALLRPLLETEKASTNSALVRVAAALAAQQGQAARAVSYLERALEIEAVHAGDLIDLVAVRRDYRALLSGYRQLVVAMTALGEKPPPDFLNRVVRAADHWRVLDTDPTEACLAAADVFDQLDAGGVGNPSHLEIAWEYLTTPQSEDFFGAVPWLMLAEEFSRAGQFLLAEQAYALAFEAEPANASILWDRAVNLQNAGKSEEAQQIFRQLVDGKWQSRYQWAQRQARQQLKEAHP